MFGGNKQDQRRSGLSVIGADVTVTGNITTDGDLHIDGMVIGDIACGSLIQGEAGRITGILTARDARLAGTLDGEVRVTALTIERTARLTGDSSYETLTIETGAHVDGRMNHRGQVVAPEPPLRLVDATDAAG